MHVSRAAACLEDLVGGGVEAVGDDIIVQHQDRMHVPQRLELGVKVGGDLAQLVTRLLRVDVVAGRVVMSGRVDDNELTLRITAVVDIRERTPRRHRFARRGRFKERADGDSATLSIALLLLLLLPEELVVGLLRLDITPAADHVEQRRLAAPRASNHHQPLTVPFSPSKILERRVELVLFAALRGRNVARRGILHHFLDLRRVQDLWRLGRSHGESG